MRQGEAAAGERLFEQERTLLTKLMKDSPGDIALQILSATNLSHIARAQDRSARPAAALATCRAAALLWEEIVSKRPTDEICLAPLAACYHKIGYFTKEAGRLEEAVTWYQRLPGVASAALPAQSRESKEPQRPERHLVPIGTGPGSSEALP